MLYINEHEIKELERFMYVAKNNGLIDKWTLHTIAKLVANHIKSHDGNDKEELVFLMIKQSQ